jgi:uncharacterized protein
MTSLHGSWLWYEIITPDPQGAKEFYEAVVGWNIQTSHADNADYGFITCADGGMAGGILRLNQDMADHGARPCWMGYIGVDDCDAAVTAAQAAGGKCLMAARDIPMAGRVAMLADPDGAAYYIMTPTPPPGGGESTAFSTALMGRCSWNELGADDGDTSLEYYTKLYGWSRPAPMDMGPMGMYHFIDHDGGGIGAVYTKPPEMPFASWNHYFRVANIGVAKTLVEANGGTVIMGPQEVPGDDWIIMGIDPQGAHFALVGGQ